MSSAPPPGYSGESILQVHGGTAEILPVMGGGRVQKALHHIRKKHSRRLVPKQRKGATKKRKRSKPQEGGQTNHYTLDSADEYKMNKANATQSVTLQKVLVPQEKATLPVVNRELATYLKEQGKLWIRKLSTPVILYSQLKPKLPTLDTIGCTFGLERVNRIVRYAPDRLCCILSRDTTSITLLPAVNGDVTTFLRIASYINAQPAGEKNKVYIFSPPFLGVNLDNNKKVFDYFLYYKIIKSTPQNLWSFYILTELTTQNIEAAKALSTSIRPDGTLVTELTTHIREQTQADRSHPDTTLITSIYSLLEPTYIIYPYTISFPITSAESITASIGKITQQEYNAQIATVKEKKTNADIAVRSATELAAARDKEYTAAAKEGWEANTFLTTASNALKTPMKDISDLQSQIDADALAINGMGTGVQGTPEYTKAMSALEAKKADLETRKGKIGDLQARYEAADKKYKEAEAKIAGLKKLKAEANTALTSAKGLQTKAGNAFNETTGKLEGLVDKEAVSNKAVPEEKGGLLFSAATKGEAILPAPYSGFDGAVGYVQTNDAQTKRGSIAYRVDAAKREPQLDAMDYEEYNLLQSPPMNDHSIFIFTLKPPNPADVGTANISQDLSVFIGSPTIVQNHVPNVSVSVGSQDYSIRSPVPDVMNDWNNGLFSTDEANYLNAMKLSPKILMGAFPNGWKKPLSEHLSMITRSNCFKDSRLLLHADCQEAQGFVSRVLNYYMTHTNDILGLQRKQGDSYAKGIEDKFKALAAKLALENGIAGKDVFDPIAFVETFFPGKKADGSVGTPGIDYLASVNGIKVDTVNSSYTVSYSAKDKLSLAEQEIIGKQLEDPDTFTESPGQKENEHIWTFTKPHSEYEVTELASRFIKTFTTTSAYDSTRKSTTFTVIYQGKLSEIDKKMIEKKLGGKYTETAQTLLNMYTWEIPLEKTEEELQNIFDGIKNANEYNFTLVENPTASAEDVTSTAPNLDIAKNRLTKVFSLALSSDPSKSIYAEFSMDHPAGKTTDQAMEILESKYIEIAKQMNGRPPQPLVFGGRYVFYLDD